MERLDASLASKRHFPSINWLTSYSLYDDRIDKWKEIHVSKEYNELRTRAMKLLQEEANLQEIVQLIGIDAISDEDRLKLEVARSLREDFLQQDAFSDEDAYTSLAKQEKILNLIFTYYDKVLNLIENKVPVEGCIQLPSLEQIAKAKYMPEDKLEESSSKIESQIDRDVENIMEQRRGL